MERRDLGVRFPSARELRCSTHSPACAPAAPARGGLVGLLVAVACAVLGGGVAERLGPYGAEDPATDSVAADRMLERAAGSTPRRLWWPW